MAIVRWESFWSINPMVNMTGLQHRLNHIFEDYFQDDDEGQIAKWSPHVEITELEDHFEVSAELPGMNRDDIKVELKNSILTISGEKSAGREEKDHKIHLCERAYGSFKRSFQLPSNVDSKSINAEFKNGILILNFPKLEEAKPKQIDIKVN
ncbi:MAG: Hsp20/alpha crystallin family protein [Candidatus Hatepunaea meridiana]|nr:Hsp20/alpha crystallin family protein [Candidatus Hatepunaea meridiana]